jgi:hypothetical protein
MAHADDKTRPPLTAPARVRRLLDGVLVNDKEKTAEMVRKTERAVCEMVGIAYDLIINDRGLFREFLDRAMEHNKEPTRETKEMLELALGDCAGARLRAHNNDNAVEYRAWSAMEALIMEMLADHELLRAKRGWLAVQYTLEALSWPEPEDAHTAAYHNNTLVSILDEYELPSGLEEHHSWQDKMAAS